LAVKIEMGFIDSINPAIYYYEIILYIYRTYLYLLVLTVLTLLPTDMNNGRKASSSEERSRRPFIRKYFWKKSIIIDRNSAVIPNYKSTGVRVVTV
jgi:hypothetical protein